MFKSINSRQKKINSTMLKLKQERSLKDLIVLSKKFFHRRKTYSVGN
jgi:hypothetical protein